MKIFSDASSCAVKYIDGLSNFSKKAKDAMLAFCRLHAIPEYSGALKAASTRLQGISTFYVFNGAIDHGFYPGDNGELEADDYASGFAAFIVANDLGPVTASHIAVNKVYNDGHCCQIFVWTPDDDKLRAWWAENKPGAPK